MNKKELLLVVSSVILPPPRFWLLAEKEPKHIQPATVAQTVNCDGVWTEFQATTPNSTLIALILSVKATIWIFCRASVPSINTRKVAIARLRHPANFGMTSQEVYFVILILTPTKEVIVITSFIFK